MISPAFFATCSACRPGILARRFGWSPVNATVLHHQFFTGYHLCIVLDAFASHGRKDTINSDYCTVSMFHLGRGIQMPFVMLSFILLAVWHPILTTRLCSYFITQLSASAVTFHSYDEGMWSVQHACSLIMKMVIFRRSDIFFLHIQKLALL